MRVYALYDCRMWVSVLFIVISFVGLAIGVVCAPIHRHLDLDPLRVLYLMDAVGGRQQPYRYKIANGASTLRMWEGNLCRSVGVLPLIV